MQNLDIKICAVEGCSKKNIARCMCSKHYAQWRRSIKGKPPKSTVKSKSNIYIEDVALKWESNSCLRWPFEINKKNYAIISVLRKSKHAHRLICEIKHGKPPSVNSQAWHTCGNKDGGCVNPNHIKWIEPSEPIRIKKRRCEKIGENHYNSKLSNKDVLEIYRKKNKEPAAKLADYYRVSVSAVYMIWSRRNYRSVTKKLTIFI